jgi:hypothetical protein
MMVSFKFFKSKFRRGGQVQPSRPPIALDCGRLRLKKIASICVQEFTRAFRFLFIL